MGLAGKMWRPGGYNRMRIMPHPMPRLILASSSPRRSELLTNAGFTFEVIPSRASEEHDGTEPPAELVKRLALEKAREVAGRVSDDKRAVVLGADTVVVLGGDILGKPASEDDARRMLALLSGREHEVTSGVALVQANGQRSVAETETTRVVFRKLTEEEIAAYVATGEPMDKAGAYAIQGHASRFVTRIEGSYFNVMGLPVALVDRLLREW